jgi:hypothetical protein
VARGPVLARGQQGAHVIKVRLLAEKFSRQLLCTIELRDKFSS